MGVLFLSYPVWSCIYLLKTAIFDGITLRHVVYALICGKAATPLYYIVVMIQLTIITPWLIRPRKKWIKKINIYWVVIALLISIAEAVILKTVGCADGFATSQIKFGSFMYAATFALWLINNRTEPRRNILSIIGDYSYGIFYCHMLILLVVRKVIELAGMNNIWILNFGLCFILTAVGSFVFVWIVRSLAHKLKCDKVLMLIGF